LIALELAQGDGTQSEASKREIAKAMDLGGKEDDDCTISPNAEVFARDYEART